MSAGDRHAAAAPQAALHRGEPWDVAVVGAGPAGTIAALHLARRGRGVLLLDAQAFPREKVCGDALLADALRCLERAGLRQQVAARAYEPTSCAVHSPGGVEVRLAGPFLTLKRIVLDDLLRRAAVANGATFAVATVSRVSRQGRAFVLSLADGRSVTARGTILATGANPSLAARSGLAPAGRKGIAAAIRGYVSSAISLDRLVVCYDRAIAPGYGWIFPLGGGEYNVGCGVLGRGDSPRAPDLHAVFETFVRSFPIAEDLVASASAATRPKGAMLRTSLAGVPPVSSEGVLAAGGAIGTTLPVSGEGIGKAMESAELAAEAADRFLTTGRIADLLAYPDAVRAQLVPTFRGYERAQGWLARPWVVDLVCRRGSRSPRYAGLLAGVLAETVAPARVLSLRGILGSFLA